MSKGLQPELTQETRQSIMEAFFDVYEGKPLDRITVVEVARRARVSRNTFYRYFKGVRDLYLEVEELYGCARVIDEILEDPLGITVERIGAELARKYETDPRKTRILCKGSEGDHYLKEQSRLFAKGFRFFIARSMELTPMQLDYVSEYIARSNASVVSIWVDRGQEIPIDQVSKLVVTVFESDFWTRTAKQSSLYGGPVERKPIDSHLLEYPWLIQ